MRAIDAFLCLRSGLKAVYQKCPVEFFVSPQLFDALVQDAGSRAVFESNEDWGDVLMFEGFKFIKENHV